MANTLMIMKVLTIFLHVEILDSIVRSYLSSYSICQMSCLWAAELILPLSNSLLKMMLKKFMLCSTRIPSSIKIQIVRPPMFSLIRAGSVLKKISAF